jgi:hypothetical protein
MIRPREAKLFTPSTATAAWGEAFYADESHHRHLHRRDEEQNHEHNQNPFFPATA